MRFKRDLVARGCFRKKLKKKKKNDGQRSQMAGTLSNSTHKFVRQYKVHVTLRTRCYRKKRTKVGTLHHPKVMLKKRSHHSPPVPSVIEKLFQGQSLREFSLFWNACKRTRQRIRSAPCNRHIQEVEENLLCLCKVVLDCQQPVQILLKMSLLSHVEHVHGQITQLTWRCRETGWAPQHTDPCGPQTGVQIAKLGVVTF